MKRRIAWCAVGLASVGIAGAATGLFLPSPGDGIAFTITGTAPVAVESIAFPARIIGTEDAALDAVAQFGLARVTAADNLAAVDVPGLSIESGGQRFGAKPPEEHSHQGGRVVRAVAVNAFGVVSSTGTEDAGAGVTIAETVNIVLSGLAELSPDELGARRAQALDAIVESGWKLLQGQGEARASKEGLRQAERAAIADALDRAAQKAIRLAGDARANAGELRSVTIESLEVVPAKLGGGLECRARLAVEYRPR